MDFKLFDTRCLATVLFLILGPTWVSEGQMSTDRRLCGGYMRETRDHIDFRFNANTAPPEIAQTNKFCLWTISPTVPTEQYRYNITIRNVNLDCNAGDRIGITFFNEASNSYNLGTGQPTGLDNPLCLQPNEVWRRENENGTVMVVILYVSQITYQKGFYMEWVEGFDARITPSRIRNTYYSWGKPSVAPNPYFAAGFHQNEISTFGFVKANYSDGYQMEMYFERIWFCEGQDDWMTCAMNTVTLYSLQDDATLKLEKHYDTNETLTEPIASKNGLFIFVKVEDKFMGGARFTMIYDTVRA